MIISETRTGQRPRQDIQLKKDLSPFNGFIIKRSFLSSCPHTSLAYVETKTVLGEK